MRIFVTDEFEDFMKRGGLKDTDIIKSAVEVNNGLVDADLGGVLKKRIAPRGTSKRDASRSIIALKRDEKIFFIDDWRKSDVPNKGKEIPGRLLETYRLIGKALISADDEQLNVDIVQGLLREVEQDG
ncbi:type II toxin-antitoxin system RelE/ParE family toxin [uncultured Ferrimonas sp.]|uniref:type II toxin-antitoxin system RelE/ParE family toxin n=1 Tax=uncultured Ferrimonas sp. TaxID=432640 RepID=UPI00262ADC12|nr:type II toxin-antitoxin system RelE/ParE family toxin [uncultured Ferrimonas sp.]